MAERRVVLADDAALERRIFERCALREGWVIAGEPEDAPTALAQVRATRPDLVVVDGRLPPNGALALLPELLAAQPGLPILVIAALDEVALLRAALEAGAAGGLQRPLRPSQVAEQLRRFARTPPAERE